MKLARSGALSLLAGELPGGSWFVNAHAWGASTSGARGSLRGRPSASGTRSVNTRSTRFWQAKGWEERGGQINASIRLGRATARTFFRISLPVFAECFVESAYAGRVISLCIISNGSVQ